MRFLIINGPNLHNIGKREPQKYGNILFADFLESLRRDFSDVEIEYYQSHIEGELISKLSSAINENFNGVVLNAGAFSHNSVAIADAVKNAGLPIVGVHISNVYAREQYRQKSVYFKNCIGIITGFGLNSYKLAILSLQYYYNGKKPDNI